MGQAGRFLFYKDYAWVPAVPMDQSRSKLTKTLLVLSVQPVPLYTVGTQAGRPQESLKLRVFDVAFLFLPFWSWVLYSYTNLPATYFHLQKHQHLLRII